MKRRFTILAWAWVFVFPAAGAPAQEDPSCCAARYRLGFSTIALLDADPASTLLDAGDRCHGSGMTIETTGPDDIYVNVVSDGAELIAGISFSIEVTGDIAITGAEIPFSVFGGGQGGTIIRIWHLADPARNDGRRGIMGTWSDGDVRFRANGAESFLRLTIDRLHPGNGEATGRIFFADGLRGPGQPASNEIFFRNGRTTACNAALAGVTLRLAPARFRRGDANGDGRLDIADPVWILDELFLFGVGFDCELAADANSDDAVDLSDALYLLEFSFLGGPPPPAPFPGCDFASPGERLGCVAPGRCDAP